MISQYLVRFLQSTNLVTLKTAEASIRQLLKEKPDINFVDQLAVNKQQAAGIY